MEMNAYFHVPAVLLPGKDPLIPTVWKAEWPQIWSGCYGDEKNIAPTRNQTPAIYPVAVGSCIKYLTI
jgi:hypothetical protein